MADRNRRFTFAAIALPFLLIAMAGLARANTIVVNTLDSGSQPFPLCTLEDAVAAANTQTVQGGCPQGTGNDDTIDIEVTGTILIDDTLLITNGTLVIQGPTFGCSGLGPCGITISGGSSVQIIDAESDTTVDLNNLTLADGYATIASPGNDGTGTGGAIFFKGIELAINQCLLVGNQAAGPDSTTGGLGGAIFGSGIDGNIDLINSTLASNTAVSGTPLASFGGAIFTTTSMTITNSTISGNQANLGGGYFDISYSSASLKATLWSNNSNGNCGTSSIDAGYNISDDASCGFGATGANGTDPLLESLANNGGPTDTFALQPTSPARSFDTDCTDQVLDAPVNTDQRLYSRPNSPSFCDSGAYEFDGTPQFVLVPNGERVQIARSTSPNSDQVNMAFTFIENGDPNCDNDEDALNHGVDVSLFPGTCAAIAGTGLDLSLSPFAVHTVNHQSYGTLFQSSPTVPSPETVSARMVALPAPAGSCGKWTLNLEVTGLDTSTLGLTGTNPFALVLSDGEVDGAGCLDITNAIVGNQILTPGHGVRRGVRRQTRR